MQPIQKKRRPWLALHLSFLCPGLGQLYNGDLRGAGLALIVSISLSLIATIYLFDSFAKLMTAIAIGIVIDLIFAIHSFIQSRRIGLMELKKFQRWWVYILFTLVLYGLPDGFGLFIPTRIQSFQIPSESMLPTLMIGDRLVADGWAYWGKDPQVGDIIVFDFPKDPSVKFVKRCIGVPGDVIELRQGELFRNGTAVPNVKVNGEEISHLGWKMQESVETLNGVNHSIYRVQPLDEGNFGPVTVPEGQYFAMGDNRDRSNDSRFWGFVPRKNIIARMSYIFFSWSEEEHRIRMERIGADVR